jgi:RimJ/RimL family protein N-acetyltransferase
MVGSTSGNACDEIGLAFIGEYLPSYVRALERGWSPDNLRGQEAAREQLARIAANPGAFLASLVDARGMRYVEITTAVGNTPSKRVIEANGGILVEEFVTPPAVGGHSELRYRVPLDGGVHGPLRTPSP